MALRISKEFSRRVIFVDTNAFVYFFTGMCNELTVELFKMGFMGKLKLMTSIRVVDELLFKIILLRARDRFGFDKKTLVKLRRDKRKVSELSNDCREVLDFIKKAKITVMEVRKTTMEAIPEIMRTNGLFGNDAITVKIMKENNVKFILTSDPDFKGVENLEVISPLN